MKGEGEGVFVSHAAEAHSAMHAENSSGRWWNSTSRVSSAAYVSISGYSCLKSDSSVEPFAAGKSLLLLNPSQANASTTW